MSSKQSYNRNCLFLGYFVLGLVLSTGLVLFDILNGGPCGELITPFVDYALPLMDDPDLGKTVAELARSRGFNFESHEVTTEDGYIIEIHRIFDSNITEPRPALVVGLTLFMSSAGALFDYRNNTIAYILADAGFDVWLTNVRGNRFGRRHVHLDPVKDKLKFHDFTLIDIGEFDYAAQIDYVIEKTGQPKVYFVGVSQGAASLFALLSKRPSYNEKIHKMVSYGGFRSICYADNRGIYFMEAITFPFTDILLNMESLALIWPYTSPFDQFCARTGNFCGLISNYAFFNSAHYVNVSRFGVYLEHIPAGTSLKNFAYFTQTRNTNCDGSVREFDYDSGYWTRALLFLGFKESKNKLVYGSTVPPLLDPNNIRVPIKLYYSDGDDVVPEKETFKVAQDLNVPSSNIHRIEDNRFSHINYIFNNHRNDFVKHTIKFFRGEAAAWPMY